MKSWLDLFIESTAESEAPERYFWWSGVAAISASVKKNVFMRRGTSYKLYPNVYVAIVSAQSGLRKGIPISKAKRYVEDLDRIRVISGCNSIQGIIKELSCQKTFKSGAVLSEAHGFLVSEEFENFLVDDPRALGILTGLQNTHENERGWTKTLRNSEPEFLKAPCLSLLVASNEALFESVVRNKDIEGGFIARTFIVHESRLRKRNSLIYTEEKMTELIERDEEYKKELSCRLSEIANVTGEFKWLPRAAKMYDSWYYSLDELNIEDRTGTFDRIGDQVIKLAMIVALSRHHMELVIEERDLAIAIKESEECLPGVKRISMEKDVTDLNPIISKILQALIKSPNHEITRKKLMNSTHIESLSLDRAIETLYQREAIEMPKRNAKKEIFYRMKDDVFDNYVKFKRAEAN